jgi:hypothetical protein
MMQTVNFEKIEVRKTEELMITLNNGPKEHCEEFLPLRKITNEKPFYSIRSFFRLSV